jgi:hypothetical protein
MRKVFISSPYRGDTAQNTMQARRYCRYAIEQGCMPFAPHLLFTQFLADDEPAERDIGLQAALFLVSVCDEFWTFGEATEGMRREYEAAQAQGVPTRHFTEEMEET